MTKSKKFMASILALALVVGGTFGATLAYLTSQDSVTNTFTVGDIDIYIDEAKTDEYGRFVDANGNVVSNAQEAARTYSNTYKLIPGRNYNKEVWVNFTKESENAWLFVKVENGIKDIEGGSTPIESQLEDREFYLVPGEKDVYYFDCLVEPGKYPEDIEIVKFILFEDFTINQGVVNDKLAEYKDANITVKVYAVQADGFDSPLDAWEVAPTDWNF